MVDKLEACPFCGGEAKRFTIGKDEPNNAGGDVIACTRCQASSHVEFGRKENLVSCWNRRTPANGEQVERVLAAMYAELSRQADSASMPYVGDGDDDEQVLDGVFDLRTLASAAINAVPTPTQDARERVKVLEEALLRIAETDRHTRRVKCNPNGGLRGQAGMIAVFALTGRNGSYLTDADVRTALGNQEERL